MAWSKSPVSAHAAARVSIKLPSFHLLNSQPLVARVTASGPLRILATGLVARTQHRFGRKAAFQIGLQTHITCYGMFGLGILSSPDFRQAMQFCADFHHLATPMVQLTAEVEQVAPPGLAVTV